MSSIQGGMAGLNSVMYFGKSKKVKASRDKKGEIVLKVEKFIPDRLMKWKQKIEKIPFLRGIWMMVRTVLMNWKAYLGILLIFMLPKVTGGKVDVFNNAQANGFLQKVLAIFPEQVQHIVVFGSFFLLFALIVKLTPLGKYHGAEHMVDNAYAASRNLSTENVMQYTRIHKNCGTNLVVFIFLFYSVLYLMFGGLLAVLLAFLLGYEVFILRNKTVNKLLKPIYLVGYACQYLLFTSQPSEQHIEVAVAAYDGVLSGN
ncbi:DUF1385 domain-containing protein [Pseudalkalibacillus sp. SCS-8]|uniref:DUF1385 domain-containing protein n=1 Tax=Pseudalkalibacillus nanhaiensis TaxID=3115291 RepID=UPI0032DBA7A2